MKKVIVANSLNFIVNNLIKILNRKKFFKINIVKTLYTSNNKNS